MNRPRGTQGDLASGVMPELSWSPEDIAGSITELYRLVEARAVESIGWYLRDRRWKKRLSRALRMAAILLTAAGGLVPLTRAAGADIHPELGYVFLALAAACVAVDRFFGFSSAWMRYMVTSVALQRRLVEFQMDWIKLNARNQGEPLTPERVQELLQLLGDFGAAIVEHVEQETLGWVAEFRSSLHQLDQAHRASLPDHHPI
jgi:hypothetical protein